MCDGVFYTIGRQEYRIYFPNPKAQLPVRKKNGNVMLLPWGRRKPQAGRLPQGGWARLDSIYAGRWDQWAPQPVRLPVSSFMEKDFEGVSRWFDITPGKWVQGLVARYAQERRVYVVTIEPEMEDTQFDRWPRVLSG